MKTIFLTIIMLCGALSAYAQDPPPPPHAASTETWVVELDDGSTQIWSDYINIPECNVEDDKETYADCHRADGIYYAYLEKYVKINASVLCPDPWRLPDHYRPERIYIPAQIWDCGGKPCQSRLLPPPPFQPSSPYELVWVWTWINNLKSSVDPYIDMTYSRSDGAYVRCVR